MTLFGNKLGLVLDIPIFYADIIYGIPKEGESVNGNSSFIPSILSLLSFHFTAAREAARKEGKKMDASSKVPNLFARRNICHCRRAQDNKSGIDAAMQEEGTYLFPRLRVTTTRATFCAYYSHVSCIIISKLHLPSHCQESRQASTILFIYHLATYSRQLLYFY